MNPDVLYIFLDEAGNFDFSSSGTAYFTFTAFSLRRPFGGVKELVDLKYDIWENGVELECFHAAEDKQSVRDRVFEVLCSSIPDCRVDCQIVEKRKTNPALQREHGGFYHRILDILLRHVLGTQTTPLSKVIVIADQIPVKRKKKDVEKATKLTLANWSQRTGVPYSVMFHSSKSDLNLQIADYLNWAVFRAWERRDKRSYDLISRYVTSEYETFKSGMHVYY